MDERRILLFILALVAFFIYSVYVWFMKQNVETIIILEEKNIQSTVTPETGPAPETQVIKLNVKKSIPLFVKDACSILEAFTEKPLLKRKREELRTENNTVTVIGITVFLIILLIHAILEAIKIKEEERARRKLNPDGERRQSLAEFANKKPLRRESSRFSLQLFQITESLVNKEEEKKTRRQIRPYKRGESINSYLSETHRKAQEGSTPASISENTTGEPRLIKRQSVAKLFGARPVPMVRRSSFPVLPLNPDIQALMLGHRQQSIDSDDEGDGRGRRVRIIRRY